MAKKPKKTEICIHQNLARFWNCEDPEILVEGPVGTGKTFCILLRAFTLCEAYPGARILFARKYLKDLRESALVTFERDVVPPNHPILTSGGDRLHRHSYKFPNGSEIVLAGLQEVEATFSAEYDVIAIFESAQVSLDDYEKLFRCLRSAVVPFQAIWCDTNPDREDHWLNKRCTPTPQRPDPPMTRIKTWFTDNPFYGTPAGIAYYKHVSTMTGHRKARLFEGKWVSAEGMIWPNFDRNVHVIDGRLARRKDGYWWLEVPKWKEDIRLGWFLAGVDWGFTTPGCLLLAGLDDQHRIFVVREVYFSGKNTDWWAEKAAALQAQFNVARFVCDKSRPETIDAFNDRMGKRDGFWIAEGIRRPPNDFLAFANHPRERMDSGKLFFLGNQLEAPDPALVETNQPTSVLDEMGDYIYEEAKEGRTARDRPDPGCVDHGCDALQYLCVYADRRDWMPEPVVESGYPAGSYGKLLEHDQVGFVETLW